MWIKYKENSQFLLFWNKSQTLFYNGLYFDIPSDHSDEKKKKINNYL